MSNVGDVKDKIISVVNSMPEDELKKLYEVLSSMPFMDKLQAGEELTEEEMKVVDQHLKDNLQ